MNLFIIVIDFRFIDVIDLLPIAGSGSRIYRAFLYKAYVTLLLNFYRFFTRSHHTDRGSDKYVLNFLCVFILIQLILIVTEHTFV